MSLPQAEGRSSFSKFVIGCAVGCGALVVIGIATVVGLAIWISGRRPVTPAEQLIPPKTDGLVIVHVRAEDQGMQALLISNMRAFMTASGQQLPPQLKEMEKGGPEATARLNKVLPLQLLVSLQYDANAKDFEPASVFSLAGYWRVLRFFVNRLDSLSNNPGARNQVAVAETFKGVKIFRQTDTMRNRTTYIGMSENNFFVARTQEEAEAVVARLVAPSEPALSPALAKLYGAIDREQDITFAVLNSHNYFQTLLDRRRKQAAARNEEMPEVPFEPKALAGVAGYVDVVSADVSKFYVLMACVTEADAIEISQRLERGKPRIIEKYPGLRNLTIKQAGADVTVDFDLTGIEQKLTEAIERAQARQNAPPVQPAPEAPMPPNQAPVPTPAPGK